MAPLEKEPGTYFFWSDWLGTEVKGCTYAAKGLWMDLLANMADETPQGVITGDLESLAEVLGFTGPMAAAWANLYGELIVELESKGVFSRGIDVDEDLPEDAIVNRRMYRKWSERVGISEARSRAARVRWDREKGVPEGRVSMAEIRAELADAECKSDAKPCKGDANGMQAAGAEVVRRRGVAKSAPIFSDAKTCLSPTQPNPTNPNPTQPRGEKGAPAAIGESLGDVQAIDAKSLYHRIIKATRDEGLRARWWNHAVNAFRDRKQLAALDDHVRYLETKGGGISNPSRYLVKRVLASARELKVVVKDVPKGGES